MKIELINPICSNKDKMYELAFNEQGTLIPTGIKVGYFKLNMHLDLEAEFSTKLGGPTRFYRKKKD